MPNPVTTVLTELATCLCAQILIDETPKVCFCGLVPGAEVAMEYAGDCADACGMAWVRLANSYPSTSIGLPSVAPGNCQSGIGLDVELGIARCVEVGQADGSPPTPGQLAASAVLQSEDMMTLWRAVACCRQSKDWVIGQYTPFGPEGGLVGGVVFVSILVT